MALQDGIYRVAVIQTYQGETFVTNLWYRNVWEGTMSWADYAVNACAALAAQVKAAIVEAAWAPIMPDTWNCVGLNVYPYNDLFELVYTLPYALTFNVEGESSSATAHHPPSQQANIRFNLESVGWTQPWNKPPASGFIAVAPIRATWSTDGHNLTEAGAAEFQTLGDLLADNLDWQIVEGVNIPLTGWQVGVGIPNAFQPIRARVRTLSYPQNLGGKTYARWIAYAHVESTAVRMKMGIRRSRQDRS